MIETKLDTNAPDPLTPSSEAATPSTSSWHVSCGVHSSVTVLCRRPDGPPTIRWRWPACGSSPSCPCYRFAEYLPCARASHVSLSIAPSFRNDWPCQLLEV